ncbi:MAG TPA: CAP domain-containing protein [Polyangia bacterium]|nr:CAP domain-containing protein [Polyangia bacterium]
MGAAAVAAMTALAVVAGDPVAPSSRRLVPRQPGAESYESKPAAAPAFSPFDDQTRTLVQRGVIAVGRREGMRVVTDARLDAAMNDLARGLREGESPHSEAVEFVLSHHGVVEPYPLMTFLRTSREAPNDQVVEHVLHGLTLPKGKPLVTVGVGLDRATSDLLVVVALQDKALDLDPVPRRLPHEGHVRVSGKLLGVYHAPHLYVTDPHGAARTLPAALKDDLFGADVRCDRGDGPYKVEVFGSDDAGPRVLANFPVYCGVAPPAAFEGAAGYDAASVDTRQAEAQLFALINRDRRAAGLPGLAPDPALANVAREHSVDMLKNHFVGHISPTTGSPADRVKHAGLTFKRLAENVARNGSVEELEIGLMASPGHRSAILDPQAKSVGVGVVIDDSTPGSLDLYATQLFR